MEVCSKIHLEQLHLYDIHKQIKLNKHGVLLKCSNKACIGSIFIRTLPCACKQPFGQYLSISMFGHQSIKVFTTKVLCYIYSISSYVFYDVKFCGEKCDKFDGFSVIHNYLSLNCFRTLMELIIMIVCQYIYISYVLCLFYKSKYVLEKQGVRSNSIFVRQQKTSL